MTKQSDFPEAGHPLVPGNDTARIATALQSTALDPSEEQSLDAALVETVIAARAIRASHLPSGLLGDPAWDMLLELIHGEITKRPVTSAVLCKAAGVKPETGRRWIGVLAAKDLCLMGQDEDEIRLTGHGSRQMRAFFSELRDTLGKSARDAAS